MASNMVKISVCIALGNYIVASNPVNHVCSQKFSVRENIERILKDVFALILPQGKSRHHIVFP